MYDVVELSINFGSCKLQIWATVCGTSEHASFFSLEISLCFSYAGQLSSGIVRSLDVGAIYRSSRLAC